MSEPLASGAIAPDFVLPQTEDKKLRLSDFQGRPVVLIFYPADWSPVCGDQLALYSEMYEMFQKYQAQLIGISVDNVWSHLAYTESQKLKFPLVSDFNPKGEIARTYGVYNSQLGMSERALFVIDQNGLIQWSYVSPMAENPGADGILQALEDIVEEEDFE